MLDKATKTDSRVKRIGWGELTLREMLLTSEHLFAETGHYYGQKTLPIRTEKPILYEKVFSHLRGGLVNARSTALNISASPIVKEIGELSFALYTPEGEFDRLVHRHHRPCAHDGRRHQTHDPQQLRGQSRHRRGLRLLQQQFDDR